MVGNMKHLKAAVDFFLYLKQKSVFFTVLWDQALRVNEFI